MSEGGCKAKKGSYLNQNECNDNRVVQEMSVWVTNGPPMKGGSTKKQQQVN